MRTTVVIDSDVAAEIERLRREGVGLSEALNLLARREMARGPSSMTGKYKHRTSRIGLKVDVTNVTDVLDLLDDDR
ncbi:CopG family transcriptional regulator [Mycolicibacterium pulveris]|uniref:CopG family transcriptional regulator n=1 Tax=Mycolicibacterium pulveris TaxID=36813 RepID=UPI003CF11759